MAVKTIAFMLPWVDPLSANSNLYNAGVIARIETSIADRAIAAGKALAVGVGTLASQDADSVAITGGTIAGLTSLASASATVTNGITSASATVTNGITSGWFEAGNGTAAAPTYTFDSDPDTGLYSIGANQLGVTTGGTLALLIDSNQNAGFEGNVGVGTSSPQRLFHIADNTGQGLPNLFNLTALIQNNNPNASASFGMLSGTNGEGSIVFGDYLSVFSGFIAYSNATDSMTFKTVNTLALTLDNNQKATFAAGVNMSSLPTSSSGLAAGDLWNDSGTLKVA